VAVPLEFFFFYGSIHSYLSVMRIEGEAARAGVTVRWRPFNLREILIEQNSTGFTRNEVKMKYVWHDVERRAKRHGIPFAGRAPYPADPELPALRLGPIAAQEGWCAPYSRATFPRLVRAVLVPVMTRVWLRIANAIAFKPQQLDHSIAHRAGKVQSQRPVAEHFERDARAIRALILLLCRLYRPHIVRRRHRGHVRSHRQREAGQRLSSPGIG